MLSKIKHLYSQLKQSIYTGERINKQLNIIKWTGLIIILIGAVTTAMNIIQRKGMVTYTTLAICVAGCVIAFSAHYLKNTRVALIAAWIFCVVFFSYYAISGTNEGFAILWTLMVPLAFGYFGGITYGISVSLYYEVLFIILFYTPVRQYMTAYYTETFIQRFPILYLTSILLNSVTMIYNHVSTLAQMEYEVKLKDALQKAEEESERARLANESKSAFLSSMSHEIRTPVNAVLGMNEMILRESSEDSVITYASNVKTAGNGLLGIINDILDFSKIEAGKMEIVPVDYDISSVINDLVNMVQTRADDKGLQLILEIGHDIPKILHGDEIRIKQVITNILTNAVKYTEKGSVTFGMKSEKISEDPDSVMLEVYIKDTGIGIKPEDMKKLFSEYERIEEARNRNVEGTGLGMNITKRLLEMMGSSLMVESTYGAGSVFSFKLKQTVLKWEPIGDYQKAYRNSLAERNKYKEKFTAPGACVLVVDDNEMNRIVFQSLIKQTLVQTDLAVDGDQGIAFSRKKKYDIIFLEHLMPGKDGIETLREIKEESGNPNINTPMICLTANAISGAREQYIAAGFDDYLTKPIDPDNLESMLMEYIPDELIGAPGDAGESAGMRGETSGADAEGMPSDSSAVPKELIPLTDNDHIDISRGIKNNGSTEAYLTILKVYYESIDAKTDELNRLLSEEDYSAYTIKVHALKSSLRIIGAEDLGEEAQSLEDAGKNGDTAYITDHHEAFMAGCESLKAPLAMIFDGDGSGTDMNGYDGPEQDKPEADAEFLADKYREALAAAEDMDCDKLEMLLAEISGYSVPEADAALWKDIKEASDSFDYERIVNLLSDQDNAN